MIKALASCKLCPRNCGINRYAGKSGYCNASKELRVARAALHHWEEPCISGTRGSGTVFFSDCSLKCVYCQNHTISQGKSGKVISISRLSDIFLELEAQGAHNINLVTPTHYVYHIMEAIDLSKAKGLSLPIVYNSSGYDNASIIKELKGYIDVYLPDIKYFDDKYASQYSNAPGYFNYASEAVKEMLSQVGQVYFDDEGIIEKGVIIRHLMLPGLLFDSKKIIDFIFSTFGHSVYISIMNQFTPMYQVKEYRNLNRTLNPLHYDCLIDYALSLGIKNAYIQESGTCTESFIPDFDNTGV
jgi:putative pyruvate formate lyase activating enzyme